MKKEIPVYSGTLRSHSLNVPASISEAIIKVSDVPVFAGVGGGLTSGNRSVRMAEEVEMLGGFGVVVNAPVYPETIRRIKESVELPVITTVISEKRSLLNLSARKSILQIASHNVSGAS